MRMIGFEKTNPDDLDKNLQKGWQLLRAGEMKGLELVYDRMVDEMYRYGMGIHSNSSFVKDCIQDVFVNLWKYRYKLKQTEAVRAYLYKSLGNKIRREIGQEQSLFHSQDTEMHFDWANSFEQEWLLDQTKEQLNRKLSRAMEQLPARQKEAVQLLFFEELPYEEVSTAMNLHIRSVYTLVWKALTSLRKSMMAWVLLFFS